MCKCSAIEVRSQIIKETPRDGGRDCRALMSVFCLPWSWTSTRKEPGLLLRWCRYGRKAYSCTSVFGWNVRRLASRRVLLWPSGPRLVGRTRRVHLLFLKRKWRRGRSTSTVSFRSLPLNSCHLGIAMYALPAANYFAFLMAYVLHSAYLLHSALSSPPHLPFPRRRVQTKRCVVVNLDSDYFRCHDPCFALTDNYHLLRELILR